MQHDTWNILASTETTKPEWKMLLGRVCSASTYILTTTTLGRTNRVHLKQMRWNGLPWNEETWHCYSRKRRRWGSTHGYGWQFEMVHMFLHTTVTVILQPHRAQCHWRCEGGQLKSSVMKVWIGSRVPEFAEKLFQSNTLLQKNTFLTETIPVWYLEEQQSMLSYWYVMKWQSFQLWRRRGSRKC